MKITALETLDLRFPTSRTQDGTDAMHTDPDYSAAYVILKTDDGPEGHGFAFTIGRGNEICAAAIDAFRHHVVGLTLNEITEDFGGFWRRLASDSQLRWLGLRKASCTWRLPPSSTPSGIYTARSKANRCKLLADMPKQLVSCIDFRYITDVLTPRKRSRCWIAGRAPRPTAKPSGRLAIRPTPRLSGGWAIPTTRFVPLPGRVAEGWTHFKVKVGADPADDARRDWCVKPSAPPRADGRREPAVGCRRGDCAHA